MTSQQGVTAKVFLGFIISPPLRLALENNQQWHTDRIGKTDPTIEQVSYEGKDYLGSYLPSDGISLAALEALEQQIHDELAAYFPQLQPLTLSFKLFTQIFLS